MARAITEQGPVQALCKEIGFEFDRRLERVDVFAAFVSGLLDEIDDRRQMQVHLVGLVTAPPPSDGSAQAIAQARRMLAAAGREAMIAEAAALHDLCHELNPDEAYPTDHLIDMVSSCASAIRFGLETDRSWGSRHAAAAADHVWKQTYGVSRFDGQTTPWMHMWARHKLLTAIVGLLPSDGTGRAPSPRSDR